MAGNSNWNSRDRFFCLQAREQLLNQKAFETAWRGIVKRAGWALLPRLSVFANSFGLFLDALSSDISIGGRSGRK
jgi:hypothetical protein